MSKPIDLIEESANAIARSLDVVVYSLDGLFERAVRDRPDYRGLTEFINQASAISDDNVNRVVARLVESMDALKASLSDSERVRLSERDDDTEAYAGEAHEAFGAFFAQAKLAYAKRLREVIAAKSFGFDTYNADPRIMLRNGQQWHFSVFAYLQTRQMLVNFYNNTKIGLYADAGIAEYTLDTEDAELMFEPYSVENYPEDAAKLFHPRTMNLVGVPYVSSEPEL